MKKQNSVLLIFILTLAFLFSACQKSTAENNQAVLQTSPTVSPALTPNSIPESNSDSPVRKIDFKNFSFPETNDYPSFKLENGEKPFVFRKEDGIDLYKIDYADLTNDGNEEAILTMSVEGGGSAMPNLIYIYTLENGKPKFLWNFMTGDRASGGLKKIYAANGELIVETFGDSKFINDKWKFDYPKGEFKGDCCPIAYTKIRFKWNAEKFVVQGNPELFDYDANKEIEKTQ